MLRVANVFTKRGHGRGSNIILKNERGLRAEREVLWKSIGGTMKNLKEEER